MQKSDKYSLWIVPDGEVGARLTALIADLAAAHNAPAFVPHITLVANIMATPEELPDVQAKIGRLAFQQAPFSVSITGFGSKDEEFRSLYLLVESLYLNALYKDAETFFPQVEGEHFAAMPHMSVMYGMHPGETKRRIVSAQKSLNGLRFTAGSFDLYKTNDPISSWQLVSRHPLK